MRKLFGLNFLLIMILIILAEIKVAYAIQENPCVNEAEVLNISNRPSKADSACTVPYKKIMAEMGYQYANLTSGSGHNQIFPELTIRFGLPQNYEIAIILPSYNVRSTSPKTGYSESEIGVKHNFGAYGNWLFGAEALMTLPSGSAAFGSANYGFALNSLLSYALTSNFSVLGMLGVTSETLPHHEGGARFNSINPDLVFSYTHNNKIEFYAEIFGQSNAGPHLGSGFNVDGGVLYAINRYWEADFSVGQRLYGELDGFNHYAAIGTAFLF